MSAGAYRGYGATQGQFAVESAVNELAQILHIDPFDLRLKNMVKEGDVMPAYYNETLTSCALDRCLNRVRKMIDWDNKERVRKVSDTKVRALGMAMSMQGSGIGNVDVGGATLRLGDEGIYLLSIAAADMGTGCDTTLSQIAAEVLECSVDNISVFGADTDASPYDSGSYASSTAYVTGKATELCAIELRKKIIAFGADMLGVKPEDVEFDGQKVVDIKSGNALSLKDIATSSMCGHGALEVTYSHSSKTSPPPFMVGACELEVDIETGEVEVVEFDAAVDCGTPLNPNLARVQAEGGLLQGIGMALSENIQYTPKGVVMNNSLMQYKIPTRMDIGKIKVEFESSYENSGPFGAKSIGEVVINTPLASIADALSYVTGVRFTELPIMPEQIALKEQFFDKK
jgi:CO/xanthine dehydrogenase Mo-binding subunit